MPRKEWIQKNRYCWNSNLDEDAFLRLLRLYCAGRPCSRAARVLARYARRYDAQKVSRQTVNRYCLLFGERLYDLLPEQFKDADLGTQFRLAGRGRKRIAPEQLEPPRLLLRIAHGVLYEKFQRDDAFNEALIGRVTVPLHDEFKVLSKGKRGMPVETFAAHFAFTAWMLLLAQLQPDEPTPRVLFELMKNEFEESPLDTRSHDAVRLVKLEPLGRKKGKRGRR